MKKGTEETEHPLFTIKKLKVNDQQQAGHWKLILSKISKKEKKTGSAP